jgi:hypothetical protein
MSPKKRPAEACHRPAGVEYFADRNAAVVLIPRQDGKGHDVVKLRKNAVRGSDRCWLVQLNSYSPFSIAHFQLLSPMRFRRVALWQLSRRNSHLDRFLPDVVRLPEVGWRGIVERLIAVLLVRGGE